MLHRTRGTLTLGTLLLLTSACGSDEGGHQGMAATGGTAALASGGVTGSGGGVVATGGLTGAGGALASGGAGGVGSATDGGTSAESGAADGGGDAGPRPPFEGEGTVWEEPAPRATCRDADSAEDGVQGLGTDVRCNFDVVGQVPAEHFLSLAWYQDCAYVNGASGTKVIDVSDSSNPTITTTLTTAGMQSNWESMKVHEGRGLLAGYQSNAPIMDVYDVSGDCTAPVLQKSYNLGGLGHSGNFSDDGTIYYASSLFSSQVFAVDVTDPKNPSVITSTFDRSTHDLFIGKNGTRGYFVYSQLVSFTTGSLAIMDLSQIQARAPGAKGTLVKEITWEDGAASQYPILVTYRGKDHIVMTDELGSGNCLNPEKPQYGYARILDISDEMNPTLVSKIKTEAQDPASCQEATLQAGSGFGVGTHYCNVDRRQDPRLLSCGLWAGGVRVFDIRNPWRPREVAYFNVPNSQVPGLTRIRVESRELWFSTGTTFYVLRFPDEVIDPILEE